MGRVTDIFRWIGRAPSSLRGLDPTAPGLVGLMFVLVLAGAGRLIGSGPEADRTALKVDHPRLVVLKSRRVLCLFDGDRLMRTYPIDLGREPVGDKRLRDDGRTPEGQFRVVSKNADSPYHRFLGIDYPHRATARWGLDRGLISAGQAASIGAAIDVGRCPDWGTALGGGIGIHGGRTLAGLPPRAADDANRTRDWTGGCIAVGDFEVEELFAVLRIGDPIEILP